VTTAKEAERTTKKETQDAAAPAQTPASIAVAR